AGRLFGVSRTNHMDAGYQASRAYGFHRLMRRAGRADTNRVVCENVKVRKLGQGRQTNRSPAVICKYGECCARRAKQPVVRYAVEDRAHAMLAYPEANVAPAGIVAA